VRIRSNTIVGNLKILAFQLICIGMRLALLSVHHGCESQNEERSHHMVRMIKRVGDRELAWVMLAVAAIAIWSTWGLVS
jgi:hypothetical protein